MLSSKQQEYLNNCNHRWNIKIGATGSGKSWIDYAYVIPKRLMSLKGQGAALILGNTQGTANRNILEPMRSIWGDKLVGTIGNDNAATLFGQRVYILGADNKKHVARIQGMTIEYAYGDEMTTWAEPVFQMLKSRLRCEHSFFDGTANPDTPLHYIKTFIDSDVDIFCQTSTIFDNPFLPKEFVDNLCKEYAGTVYYDRFILGKWALAEGMIYSMYQDAIAEPPDGEPSDYCLSIDYGTMNAFSAGLWGKYGDVWYRIREYYYSGRDTGVQKTDEEYAVELDKLIDDIMQKRERESGSYLKKMETIIDPSAASFIALLQKKTWYKVISADNAVLDGIRETASVMQTEKIKISPDCKNLIKELQGYVWDEKSKEEDKPVKINDHACDDMRYFVKTKKLAVHKAPYKPIWNK